MKRFLNLFTDFGLTLAFIGGAYLLWLVFDWFIEVWLLGG